MNVQYNVLFHNNFGHEFEFLDENKEPLTLNLENSWSFVIEDKLGPETEIPISIKTTTENNGTKVRFDSPITQETKVFKKLTHILHLHKKASFFRYKVFGQNARKCRVTLVRDNGLIIFDKNAQMKNLSQTVPI